MTGFWHTLHMLKLELLNVVTLLNRLQSLNMHCVDEEEIKLEYNMTAGQVFLKQGGVRWCRISVDYPLNYNFSLNTAVLQLQEETLSVSIKKTQILKKMDVVGVYVKQNVG